MRKILLMTMVFAPLLGGASVNLTGAWMNTSSQCKLSGPISSKIKPILDSVTLVFDNKTVSQSMVLMPNCILTSEGSYEIAGDLLQFGAQQSKVSSGCPAGTVVTDKPAIQNRFRIENGDLLLETPAGFFCTQANDLLEMRFKKNSRWSPSFRY